MMFTNKHAYTEKNCRDHGASHTVNTNRFDEFYLHICEVCGCKKTECGKECDKCRGVCSAAEKIEKRIKDGEYIVNNSQ